MATTVADPQDLIAEDEIPLREIPVDEMRAKLSEFEVSRSRARARENGVGLTRRRGENGIT